jgi:hypothetical protein
MSTSNRCVGPAFLAPGRHVFAPLPGGLRRSAKTRSVTAAQAISRCSRAGGFG